MIILFLNKFLFFDNFLDLNNFFNFLANFLLLLLITNLIILLLSFFISGFDISNNKIFSNIKMNKIVIL